MLAGKRPEVFSMCQLMVLQMLLLLECLAAAFYLALELPIVTLHMPVELGLAHELTIDADGTLEFNSFPL